VKTPIRTNTLVTAGIGRLGLVTLIALAVLLLPSLASSRIAAPAAIPTTGFVQPFAGTPKYQQFAAVEAVTAGQVNRPLGRAAADRIARKLGLDKRHAFTPRQYRLFITGRGNGAEPASAKLVDLSVRIFTNTTGNPLVVTIDGKPTRIVLGSYGLMVNEEGMLESLANTDAPTRRVNVVIAPGGYMGKWCRRNGAEDSLRMLYRSAYSSEVVYGANAQKQSGAAQLVPNQKGGRSATVGMSMAPSIWIVNFALLYMLNPDVAAKMPAWWTPIPQDVAAAIEASSTGQVSYSDYESSFPG
jgi:hypothetical protein